MGMTNSVLVAGLPTMTTQLPNSMNPSVPSQFNSVYKSEQKDTTDVLTLDDILLLNALMDAAELYTLPYVVEQVTASIVPTDVFESELEPFWRICFKVLPRFVKQTWGIRYAFNLDRPFLGDEVFKEDVKEAKKILKAEGLLNATLEKYLKLLSKSKSDPQKWDVSSIISPMFSYLKLSFARKLPTDSERALFKKFFYIFTEEELNLRALEGIMEFASRIPDLTLRRYLKSIRIDSNQEHYSFLLSVDKADRASKKIFGTTTPSQKQIERIYNKYPEKYKEWRVAINDSNRKAKAVLSSAWEDAGLDDIVDVEEIRELCKAIGFKYPIDDGFEGKVSLGPTAGTVFTYYTKYGKKLEGIIGYNVTMNPKYTSEDNTYYCTCTPAAGVSHNIYRQYTSDFRNKSAGKLFTRARETVDVIEDIRRTIVADMKKGDWGVTCLSALVTRVLDITAGRIGNRIDSEKNGIFGIHNLQMRHMKKLDSGYLQFTYIGKKGVKHTHIIKDYTVISIIRVLTEGRTKNQFIFSKDGRTPISVSSIQKYLKNIGFPGTAHTWRKYHANALFERAYRDSLQAQSKKHEKKNSKTSFTPNIKLAFNEAVEKVAERLQNTPSVCIGSYIDANLMMDVFKRNGVEPPAPVKRAFAKRKDINPDAEVDD